MKRLVCLAAVMMLAVGCGQQPTTKTSPSPDVSQPAKQAETPAVAAQTPAQTPAEKPAEKAASVDPASWPRFHGPRLDNISLDKGLLAKWPDEGPKLLWMTPGIGHGFSSAAVADGRIYIDGNAGDNTTITALDLDGKVVWQSPNGKAWTGDYPGTHGTPTLDGQRLYHESPLGRVTCLDAADGKEIWHRDLLADFDAKNIKWALAESVLIDGDRVICCPGGPKASIVALNKKTGENVWTAESAGENAGYASPVPAEFQGLRMILAMTAQSLIGVDADSGAMLFRHEHKTEFDVNATMPLFHDGQVFITSGYNSGSEMLQLAVSGKKVTVSRLWECKKLDNQHGGVVLWDGYIYGSSMSGKWFCLDWKTGDVKYAERGVGKGSLTLADGMLYTFSETRKVGLVKAMPEKHEVISKFTLPAGGDGSGWAHPVVCGGRLYLRHSDQLSAYDLRASQ
jgi:outer membrane protein assembly factor BamB